MDASTLVLPALIGVSLLAIITSAIGIVFQIRRERLPDSTRYENIRERRLAEEQALADRRAELSIVEQKIQQRDRLIAEVSAYEERIGALKAEMDALEPARADIEATRRQAADAAADLADAEQELDDVEEKIAARKAEWEALDADRDAKQSALAAADARLEQLTTELERLRGERSELERELGPLRAERDAALRTIEEARLLESRVASMRNALDQLQQEIASAADQRADLESARLELLQKRSEIEALTANVSYLEARKAKLDAETGAGVEVDIDTSEVVSDLKIVPHALALPARLRGSKRSEADALAEVSGYLKNLGLRYPDRTVRAFHTALKINDYSQLTVLAGVSGTGKSLLPRRYAEAMGIHFLQIAVEPRWDSPQDLLGFYNYVEKRYRATDLTRMLVQLDPYNTTTFGDGSRHDHMALVLLDEMNLARVEYYFSEFLSRLEARPKFGDADDATKRNDARIPLDIRGLKQSLSLFPSHNILFAGTMNDDESTQALSDKVLDRGNVMQFAAPKSFEKPKADIGVERPSEGQSFSAWRSWVKSPDAMSDQRRRVVDDRIGRLAAIMERSGRPFGHRLRDAILAYVVNYPSDGSSPGDNAALADQIEFRILPKLRGIELEGREQEFDDLQALLGELNEGEFASRIAELREQQQSGTGLFVWRGITRGQ